MVMKLGRLPFAYWGNLVQSVWETCWLLAAPVCTNALPCNMDPHQCFTPVLFCKEESTPMLCTMHWCALGCTNALAWSASMLCTMKWCALSCTNALHHCPAAPVLCTIVAPWAAAGAAATLLQRSRTHCKPEFFSTLRTTLKVHCN